MSSILFGNTSKILSSFWGIVPYVRNIILLGLTTKDNATQIGSISGTTRFGMPSSFRVESLLDLGVEHFGV